LRSAVNYESKHDGHLATTMQCYSVLGIGYSLWIINTGSQHAHLNEM